MALLNSSISSNRTIMQKTKLLFIVLLLTIVSLAQAQPSDTAIYHEQYRPQVHFSPKQHWMNDPNGMVYNNGIYHLFYQYYPGASVWGPMHWGHATSPDMIHWTEQPIALYPDSLGYIFSGSAVLDKNNTSGFGQGGKAPLVAIYTSHDTAREHAGSNDFQTQSIAYSLDNGKTWTKYSGNPVVKNPGIRDYRDPKVSWNEESKKWIMTLATKDRITFFSSPNLKDWTKESEFGEKLGAHGGVWECPDLISFDYQGKKVWVLIVNINPGGPNGGSATQYFTGNFDGHHFAPDDSTTKWLDYGPDEYAGITWSNTGDRKIFLGWMSNWDYATIVPTLKWRSATTIPRDLGIKSINNQLLITSQPVKELDKIAKRIITITNMDVSNYSIAQNITSPYSLSFTSDTIKDFSFTFSNEAGEQLMVGYDRAANQYYIDRTKAGESSFKQSFAKKAAAPRFAQNNELQLTLVVDAASVELFADGGLTTMTSIFFPKSLLNQIHIQSPDKIIAKTLLVDKMQGIWRK
jgi:fructan beta-fructosidase